MQERHCCEVSHGYTVPCDQAGELRNIVERGILLADNGVLDFEHLPQEQVEARYLRQLRLS